MLVIKPYLRERAVRYAEKYAFSQNPLFASFRGIGGNCTNFVSQAIYAASCVMNYTPTFGWYYISLDDRSPSWSGVEYFYNFMVSNRSVGPYATDVPLDRTEIGDVIQLGNNTDGYYHTLLIVGYNGDDPLVAAQTNDAYMRPLSTYTYDYARYLHIEGVRLEIADPVDCFERVLAGRPLADGETDGAGAPPIPSEVAPSEPSTPVEEAEPTPMPSDMQ